MVGKVANVISRRLNIQRGVTQLEAILVIAFDRAIGALNQTAAQLLGPTEAAYYSSFRYERRQQSYLLGRYAAKVALSEVLAEPNLKSIQIVKGVFEQPIVRYQRGCEWAVTIGHTESLAVGLAYQIGHPMGVDIERIEETRYQTILFQLCQEELCWVKNAATDRHKFATALWKAKEALSKALTTGLMTPVEIYSLTSFRQICAGLWEGQFTNFAQYKEMVWTGSSYGLSIAMPKASVISGVDDLHFAL